MKVALPKTLGYHNQGYLATHAFYGSSSLDECPSWDINRFKEVRPWDWYMGEMTVDLEEPSYPIGGTTKVGTKVNPQMEACTGIPMYDGQPVEVGPRARLVTSTRTMMRKAPSARTLPVRWNTRTASTR